MSVSRRLFMAGAVAGAAGAVLGSPSLIAQSRARGAKRLTLLHLTDTHAQLETHPEYLPGQTPDIRPMGGFARLKTAIDRARADAAGPSPVAAPPAPSASSESAASSDPESSDGASNRASASDNSTDGSSDGASASAH